MKSTISKQVEEGQEFCKELDDFISESFLVAGKTMKQWKLYFKIDFPEEMTFQLIIEKSAEIGKKYQQAAFYRDGQQVQLAILEQHKGDTYNEKYNQLRAATQESTGKPLAAESCRVAATLAVKDLDSAMWIQKATHGFWTKTCDTLVEMRKIVETMGFALSGDARIQKEMVVKTERQQ